MQMKGSAAVRQLDPHIGAGGARGDPGASAMGGSDRLNDGEAEAGPAAGARGIAAAEAVEGTVAKAPESAALVSNMQRHSTRGRLRRATRRVRRQRGFA